mgnify:CR=1 FL=1
MARTVSLSDDLDGASGAKERTYSIAGIDYEVDLTDDNWANFLNAIEYVRSVSRVKRQGEFRLTDEDRAKIRVWAQENGLQIKPRGRFPHNVIQAYFDSVAGDSEAV